MLLLSSLSSYWGLKKNQILFFGFLVSICIFLLSSSVAAQAGKKYLLEKIWLYKQPTEVRPYISWSMSVKETTTSQWGYLGVQNISWEKSFGTRNGCPNPYSKISVTKQTNSHVMQHCRAITMHGFVAFRFYSNRNIHVFQEQKMAASLSK